MNHIRRIGACVLPFALYATSWTWSAAGHGAAASIAYSELKPEVRKKVDDLLKGTGMDFVAASTWADITKTKLNDKWHYINYHFRTDGKPTSNEPAKQNVVWAIEKFERVFWPEKDGEKEATPAQKTEALRYLIHFVVDVHQPLHAVARDSDAHPKGDGGGNLFWVMSGDKSIKLHSYWDSGTQAFPQVPLKMTAQDEATVKAYGEQLLTKYQVTETQLKVTDPDAWAKEGLDLAKTLVYRTEENAEPSKEYVAEGQAVCGERIVLAGKRLAALLNRLLE